jgi:tRNA A-37 threonylcarbamoyl transferase component Bud32
MTQLEKRTEAFHRRWLRRRDRRTLRTSHDYVALRTAHGRAHGVSGLETDALKQLASAPEILLWQNVHQPVKLDRGSMIVEAELPLKETTVRVAYKRYRPQKWWKALLAPLRPARAVQGWQRGHALQLRGIPVARPVVAVDRRRPWYRNESYLAVEWIEGSENLHLYLWRQAKRDHGVRMRQANRCAESLGALLGRMHAQRVLHGDLKASNLLITDHDGQIESFLVDVDDVCLDADTSLDRRAADLARLAVSIEAHPWVSWTVRARLLRAYLENTAPGKVDWKCLWREITRRSERITSRKRRRKQTIL